MKETAFIVAHQAVMRTLLAYFLDAKLQDLPHMPVPLHSVFRLTPTPFGIRKTVFAIDVDRFEAGEEVFWIEESG
jgi:broad specificity phosphatase PhoE